MSTTIDPKILAAISASEFVDKIVGVFCRANVNGYAGSSARGTIATLPGSKCVEYTDGPWWRVVDFWFTTPLGHGSAGTTLIYYKGVLVWQMQYSGRYHPDAIPCLKAALWYNYSHRIFFAGRGPQKFTHEGMVYSNETTMPDPRLFECAEQVEPADGGPSLGFHNVSGGIMFDVNLLG